MGNNVPASIANMSREELDDLIADSTCTICQDLFEDPLRLKCSHTFCKKCINHLRRQHPEMPGLMRMLLMRLDSDEPALCPLCRTEIDFDAAKENENVLENLKKLKIVKNYCCNEDGCWSRVQKECEVCKQRLCENHDEQRHQKLRKEAAELRDQLGAFTRSDKENEELSQLLLEREMIPAITASLVEMVQQAMLQYDHQVARSMREIQANAEQGHRCRRSRSADLEQLEAWLAANNLQQLQEKLQAMRSRLQQSQRDSPARSVAQQLRLGDVGDAVSAICAQLEPHTFVDAYKHVQPLLQPVSTLRTKHEVWDMQVLTNTTGLTVRDKVLRLQQGARQLRGPCVVVNFKGFPTGKLHLTDLDGQEFGVIELEFRGQGMVGRFTICNQHQLLCASDAGRHVLHVCSLDGRLLLAVGQEGTGPGDLQAPLGMHVHAGLLYVADSDNRRVQIFDADQGFKPAGCVQHDKMSDAVCDVRVSDSFIVALDSTRNSLFVFDTSSRQFVRQQKLEGSGFQLAGDRHGNIFVSLPQEARIQAFNPDCSVCIKTFACGGCEQHEGIQRLNGLALEPQSGRLFFADTFREIIYILQV